MLKTITQTKVCYTCNTEKDISLFRLNRGYIERTCKQCVYKKRIVTDESKEKNRKYRRTKKGMVYKMHSSQTETSKRRGNIPPLYSKEELFEWIISQDNFNEIYNNWVDSNYEKNLKPSIDRLDDYSGYSFDNIQLMTWGENKTKGELDKFNGINKKTLKKVNQISLDNLFIKEHYSISKAERETGANHSHISSVCKGKRKSAGGYRWEYSRDLV